jgi:hypothetical protein
MNYDIRASSLRCVKTGRELRPGERFYSVLFERDGALVREDICAEAWQGPPAETFSFWQSKAPPSQEPRRIVVDDEALLENLERLQEAQEPRQANFRYVIALLLTRRKRLRFDNVEYRDGREFLVLRCPKTRNVYRVLNPQLKEQQLAEVQQEVQAVLGIS